MGPCEGPHESYKNMAVAIYRGPSGSGSKSDSSYGKETKEQEKQKDHDIKADCALKAATDLHKDDDGVDPKTKERIVVLTLDVGSIKARLERSGAPPATQREVYKILGIPWNEKDEEWF